MVSKGPSDPLYSLLEEKAEVRKDYKSLVWARLPEDVQAAAIVFGFDETKWDANERVPDFDKEWPELTEEQQQAALTLGYTAKTWCIDEELYENKNATSNNGGQRKYNKKKKKKQLLRKLLTKL